MARCASGTYGQTCQTTSDPCSIVDPCTAAGTCQSGDGTATCQCQASKFDAVVDIAFYLVDICFLFTLCDTRLEHFCVFVITRHVRLYFHLCGHKQNTRAVCCFINCENVLLES